MKNSLAFFLKKGTNVKLPKGQTLQCNSDASQFTQFSSKNTDIEMDKFLNYPTMVNLKQFLISNEANVITSQCRNVYNDVPAFMLHILEAHNRIETSEIGWDYYGDRINCSKCKCIKGTGHSCVAKEECAKYITDVRTKEYSQFKNDSRYKFKFV